MELMFRLYKSGWRDIYASIKKYELAGIFGWQDIRQRYRRSALGPFWLTISMGILIGALGLIFGTIFAAPTKEFLPFLTIGLTLWTLITTSLNEGCMGFTASEAMIKQIALPLFIHILRVLWRNLIIFGHNLVIYPIVMLAFLKPIKLTALLAIPGVILLIINLSWITLILGVLCARFRDVPQIVSNLLQVFFYLTPIIWMPQLLPKRASFFFLDANPFFHLIEIVRAPLLGVPSDALNWQFSVLFALTGWCVTLPFYGRFRSRIAYWI